MHYRMSFFVCRSWSVFLRLFTALIHGMQTIVLFQKYRSLAVFFLIVVGTQSMDLLAKDRPRSVGGSAGKHGGVRRDSTTPFVLPMVEVRQSVQHSITPLPLHENTILYAGKKTERLHLVHMTANLALNNTRQTFAQMPGVFLWENDGSGVQANIGIRGLSPNRSWELNTRQDGYDISSDPFGYPEAYYTPSFEMLEGIDVVRGASSLQFGPQFGGMINYRTKSAPRNRTFSGESSQIIGAGNLYSTYTALGGTIVLDTTSSLSYYGAGNFRRGDGWRANSGFRQTTLFGTVAYHLSPRTRIGFAVTSMAYTLQQPAGLTEAQYADNPRQSFRSRDWFSAQWLMPVLTFDHEYSGTSHVSVKIFGLAGERNSIGLITSTAIADTGTNRRRVNTDAYRNIGVEARWLTQTHLFHVPFTLTGGMRYSYGHTERKQGRGQDGTSAVYDYVAPLSRDLRFSVMNTALFAEATLAITDDIRFVPGLRFERLQYAGSGSSTREYSMTSARAFDTLGLPTTLDARATEWIPLMGLGVSVRLASQTLPSLELYGNIAQAYRPVLFSDQFQTDLTAVDPALSSSTGYTSDLGVRGTYHGLRWDISGFFLRYDNRVGTLPLSVLSQQERALLPAGATALRTNIAASHHQGIETMISMDLAEMTDYPVWSDVWGSPSAFVSASYTSARYVGDVRTQRNALYGTSLASLEGNHVEFAPAWIVRSGMTWRYGRIWSVTMQWSYVSESYSNSANTLTQADGQQGLIPAYSVADISMQWQVVSWIAVEASINNLFDARYMTRRATGYPGPGIIPADGRMWMAGIRLRW